MSRIERIKNELANAHPVTGAYSADDQAAADELNAKNVTNYNPIPSSELLAWAGGASSGQEPRIVKIQENIDSNPFSSNDKAVRAISVVADRMIMRDGTSLDLNRADRMGMVNALVAGGVISNEDKNALLAMAEETVSQAEKLALGTVTAQMVKKARSL